MKKRAAATAPDFQKLFEASANLSLILSPGLEVLAASDAYLRAFSAERHSLVGQHLNNAFAWQPQVLEGITRSLKQVLLTGQAQQALLPGYGGAQEQAPWLMSNSCIMAGKGGVLYLVHQVTPQNAALLQQDAVAQLHKELESLAYSISHDVRAPLRAINGYVQILQEDYDHALDDEGRRMLSVITYNTGKMSSLIDNLLALSRTTRRELKKTEVNLYELVEGAILEINKTINHEAQIKIDTPHAVRCDYGLMNQVMMHLIGNAIKYSSKAPSPLIEIRSQTEEQSVVFSVKDNGVGFDMRYADKLFGAFQRLHSAEEFDGAGIGLAIVQRIISRHGGKVWAESKPGEGATFSFSLPAHA